MTIFNPNIPQPGDQLSDSQVDLLNNNLALDAAFGVDHYPFSSVTNSGMHNKIDTPLIVNNPTTPTGHPYTATGIPAMYAMQDSANIGVIDYSMPAGNLSTLSVPLVPTPLTKLQSSITPFSLASATSVALLDFTGITSALCIVYAGTTTVVNNFSSVMSSIVYWQSSQFYIQSKLTTTFLSLVGSGSVLSLFNNYNGGAANNVVWTLEFLRITQ